MAAAPDDDRARDRRRAGGRGAPPAHDRPDAGPPRPRESVSAMNTREHRGTRGKAPGPLLDHASNRPAASNELTWRASDAQKRRVSEGSRHLPRVIVLLVVLLALVHPAASQTKREDPLQSEQKKLQQTQKRLKEEREKAAAARARETSLLAELEEIERRLAEKQP